MTGFQAIRERAAARKGGEPALRALLPPVDPAALAATPDDRALALMAKCIFRSGFVWRVIEQKWPGFEEAFLGFEPARLAFQPDEFWQGLAGDVRIVRNPQKIRAVRDNAVFVRDIAAEHGSFAAFLAAWPADDEAGLLDLLARRGARLGGMTGQYFLRFVGWDAFILSKDVVAALRESGLDISGNPTSKADLRKIEARFSAWREETGLGYAQLSRVLAMSTGENYAPAEIAERSERAGQ